MEGPPPPVYRHVIVIMDENKSFSDIIGPRGSAARRDAPFLNTLAASCGLATHYYGVTHPSHPNYTAVTGGIHTMHSPARGPNIFDQVRRSGRAWRSYNFAMRRPCQRTAVYPYKPDHNAGIAWSRNAAYCDRWDVAGAALAGAVARHQLPAYAFITPDQCHNMHAACSGGMSATRAGDNWLRKWVGLLVRMPSYQLGRTAIFITWDEGSHGQSRAKRGENCLAPANRHDQTCHLPTLVLSAYVRPGSRNGRFLSHYSLLHTTEVLLGLQTFVGHAADPSAKGMRLGLGL
jgi:hypothetical protein